MQGNGGELNDGATKRYSPSPTTIATAATPIATGCLFRFLRLLGLARVSRRPSFGEDGFVTS
jgi:hypothetical protein